MHRKALLIVDRGSPASELCADLLAGLDSVLRVKGYAVDVAEVRRSDTPPCTGCLHCLTRHPGECVHRAAFAPLVQKADGCGS